MSGLLLGILLARAVSGSLSAIAGWRSIYLLASVLMLISAIWLWQALPQRRESVGMDYPQLLASVLQLLVEEPVLRLRALLGMMSFCLFALFWTPLAFLLANEPYEFSDATIGLFGLVGAVGAFAASLGGRLADRGKGYLATLIGLAALLLAWIPLVWAEQSLIALLVGVVILDLAVQLVHVSNQNAVYALQPQARNRLNAGYITCYFIGGALGSILGSQLYQWQGWSAVVVSGISISLLALAVGSIGLAIQRRTDSILDAQACYLA